MATRDSRGCWRKTIRVEVSTGTSPTHQQTDAGRWHREQVCRGSFSGMEALVVRTEYLTLDTVTLVPLCGCWTGRVKGLGPFKSPWPPQNEMKPRPTVRAQRRDVLAAVLVEGRIDFGQGQKVAAHLADPSARGCHADLEPAPHRRLAISGSPEPIALKVFPQDRHSGLPSRGAGTPPRKAIYPIFATAPSPLNSKAKATRFFERFLFMCRWPVAWRCLPARWRAIRPLPSISLLSHRRICNSRIGEP